MKQQKEEIRAGQQFGQWTVLEKAPSARHTGWLCRCGCGTERVVREFALRSGKSQSCGCISRGNAAREKGKDLLGQRFGDLEVLERLPGSPGKNALWRCRCHVCGGECQVFGYRLTSGNQTDCGCRREEEPKPQVSQGQRFGRLTALRLTEGRDSVGCYLWECRCDCGTVVCYSPHQLLSGKIKSCGCLYRESRQGLFDYRKDYVEDTVVSMLVSTKQPRHNNASGCTGVCLNRRTNKWLAYISVNKKRYNLGSFSSLDQAIQARKAAERKLHDPVVLEYLDKLTEHSREKFLEYIRDTSE